MSELESLKEITDKLDYNTSTAINRKYLNIMPKLKEEYERMVADKIDIKAPKIRVIMRNEIHLDNIEEYMNGVLSEIASTGAKIIDYGVNPTAKYGESMIYGFITYTL